MLWFIFIEFVHSELENYVCYIRSSLPDLRRCTCNCSLGSLYGYDMLSALIISDAISKMFHFENGMFFSIQFHFHIGWRCFLEWNLKFSIITQNSYLMYTIMLKQCKRPSVNMLCPPEKSKILKPHEEKYDLSIRQHLDGWLIYGIKYGTICTAIVTYFYSNWCNFGQLP